VFHAPRRTLQEWKGKKTLRWWEHFILANGTSFLEKYLKTMKTFILLDLHHLFVIARGILKSWLVWSERSSSRVGRMIALKLCSPKIAPNYLRVGHNFTPLNWKTCQVGIQNSVAAHRRGSSALICWKKEIQERPRGMRASLKLRLSLLIHIETSK